MYIQPVCYIPTHNDSLCHQYVQVNKVVGYVAGQNEIHIKMTFFCLLTLIIHGS